MRKLALQTVSVITYVTGCYLIGVRIGQYITNLQERHS